jgi:hypothetical protein
MPTFLRSTHITGQVIKQLKFYTTPYDIFLIQYNSDKYTCELYLKHESEEFYSANSGTKLIFFPTKLCLKIHCCKENPHFPMKNFVQEYPGVKRPGCEADHSSPATAEVKTFTFYL